MQRHPLRAAGDQTAMAGSILGNINTASQAAGQQQQHHRQNLGIEGGQGRYCSGFLGCEIAVCGEVVAICSVRRVFVHLSSFRQALQCFTSFLGGRHLWDLSILRHSPSVLLLQYCIMYHGTDAALLYEHCNLILAPWTRHKFAPETQPTCQAPWPHRAVIVLSVATSFVPQLLRRSSTHMPSVTPAGGCVNAGL
jgi:hypothetical protein